MVWCGMVWFGVVWCDNPTFLDQFPSKYDPHLRKPDSKNKFNVKTDGVWFGVVWYGVVWCGVVWCGVVWCGMVWYGMVWYGVV